MERSAAANGFALEARAARRISAAAGRDPAKAVTGAEAAAGTWAGAARYPRLIWVSDEEPGLELAVPDASLTLA
jgi:hypothetical protein